ncbi:coproporphyrinogen III oxidase [Fennellomyces sp. T-0311]|nr:coproporphyrinogen III oxidase [Fennellomyces sp. T-0311]
MVRELEFYLTEPRFGLSHKRVTSVYFGGGTPSLSSPATVANVLNTITRHVPLDPDIEITLEANPTSSELARLRSFRDAGINRLSLGIQSFKDADLKVLGRDHSAESAIRTLEEAKQLFNQVTFDMIFARPRQTLADWKSELKQALELAGDHLSMYQLSFERGTPLWKSMQKAQVANVDPELAADMYEEAVQTASQHGFAHYEVSSYARNRSAISTHNFSYWQGLDYVGPGAHGRLTNTVTKQRVRTFGEFHPEKYMTLCESEGEGIRKWVPLSSDDTLEEMIVFGLRTRMGIPQSRFKKMTGQELDSVIDPDFLALCVQSGFLVVDGSPAELPYVPKHLEWEKGGGIRPTEEGLARMDSILPQLLRI